MDEQEQSGWLCGHAETIKDKKLMKRWNSGTTFRISHYFEMEWQIYIELVSVYHWVEMQSEVWNDEGKIKEESVNVNWL